MDIQKIEIYKLNGKEYRSLKQIKTEVENIIGEIIDQVNPRLTPKQKLDFLQVIIKNKKELCSALSIGIDLDDTNLHGDYKNILDIYL